MLNHVRNVANVGSVLCTAVLVGFQVSDLVVEQKRRKQIAKNAKSKS
ncbi:MAG: hypothetical protein HOO10_04885 [Candidatus Marinimicrobia bacterium]|jgi:hypothetical protein|nr:hypothetical protein [Candidatus Neomarinimicrobiota bacterium]